MQTVVSQRHRPSARRYGGFAAGKTGTTENYGDAWFVGFTDKMTIAVWVGYPEQHQVDGPRLRRRAGRGRHLPGRDLARLRRRRARIQTQRATPTAARADVNERRRRRACRRSVLQDTDGTDDDRCRPTPRRAGRAVDEHAVDHDRRRLRHSSRRRRRRPSNSRRRHRRSRRRRTRGRRHRTGGGDRRAATDALDARRPRSASRAPGGHGFDTWREPAAQNRHGRSGALVIPIRVPTSDLAAAGRRAGRAGSGRRRGPCC